MYNELLLVAELGALLAMFALGDFIVWLYLLVKTRKRISRFYLGVL